MNNYLDIEIYPEEENSGEEIDQFLQTTMAEQGIQGVVRVCYVLPELLENFGISCLPAILINGKVILEGRLPTKRDVISWFKDINADEDRASPVYPHQMTWPQNLNDAVMWLIDHMHESDKKELFVADNNTMMSMNFHWGQGIRNGFGLWAGNDSLLSGCGTDDPEEASLIIIKAVRERIRRDGFN
jgi:hypothetical protein